MNWLDFLLIVIFITSLISGLRLGFVYKLGSLVGYWVGIYLAARWTPGVASWFGGSAFAAVAVFFGLPSLLQKGFSGLAWLLDKLFSIVKIIPLVTTANRLLGAMLGIVVSLLFWSTILYVTNSVLGPDITAIDQSIIAPIIIKLSIIYKPLLSEHLAQFGIGL